MRGYLALLIFSALQVFSFAASPEPMNVEEAQLGYDFTLNDHKIARLVIGD